MAEKEERMSCMQITSIGGITRRTIGIAATLGKPTECIWV